MKEKPRMRKLWIKSAAAAALIGLAAAPAFAQAARSEAAGQDVTVTARTRGRAAIGAEVTGVLSPEGDKDWYKIRLEAGQTYRIGVSGAGEEPLSDPLVRVLDRSGAEVATDDDSGGNLNGLAEVTPTARGDFYIEARGFDDDATGGYVVSVRQGDIPADTTTDAALSADGDQRGERLAPAGDRDWFKATLAEGQTVRVRLNTAEGGGLNDPLLVIYDGTGTEVARDDDSGGALNAAIEFTAATAGDYFLEARGFGDDAEGGYTLSLTNGEIGADSSTADHIEAGGAQSSQIAPEDDVDWFGVDLVEGRSYRFFLDAEGEALDPKLELLNGEGQSVKSDDDGGAGLNARVEYVAPQTGTYYLAASAFSGGGRYTLRAADQEVPGAGSDETVGVDDARDSAIDFNGDKDQFVASLEAGASYVISVDATGSGPTLLDPVVSVLSPDGFEIATDDDSGPGQNARLTFTPQQAGDFVVQVSGFAGSTGSYTVKIEGQ
jgi:hypothetical protein